MRSNQVDETMSRLRSWWDPPYLFSIWTLGYPLVSTSKSAAVGRIKTSTATKSTSPFPQYNILHVPAISVAIKVGVCPHPVALSIDVAKPTDGCILICNPFCKTTRKTYLRYWSTRSKPWQVHRTPVWAWIFHAGVPATIMQGQEQFHQPTIQEPSTQMTLTHSNIKANSYQPATLKDYNKCNVNTLCKLSI